MKKKQSKAEKLEEYANLLQTYCEHIRAAMEKCQEQHAAFTSDTLVSVPMGRMEASVVADKITSYADKIYDLVVGIEE